METLNVELFTDENRYKISHFDCGKATLNKFLIEHLRRQHNGKVLRAYVLKNHEADPKILGYYTLSGGSFERSTLPSRTQQKKIPYKNVPCVTLGRLAVDKTLQGQGWRSTLVSHAMSVVYNASLAVGIHGMFVDALDDEAKQFYTSFGFIELTDENSRSLFYPTQSIEKLFQ
ncbi:GNAT family N-acetyltransferase [Pantoea alhagi]|uniref:GNAT family N-acetyltransferase n=1 Tax=Pantoea alhagi TaxID=1891675 RepID=A0A1W6B1Q6_9GAMM|nr:GNAT family N-acetyltransferase [Pantoea alhagi]ARJ41006.1 GNAT family N-acetyltransferase [Pantoea alhagi]